MNYILVLVVGLLTLLLLIFAVTLTIKIMKERVNSKHNYAYLDVLYFYFFSM